MIVTPLDPQPGYGGICSFEKSLDPFHADAFVGTPAEGVVKFEGKRKKVWLAMDKWKNAVGILNIPEGMENATVELRDDVWCWVLGPNQG